tara:strand:- start:14 stop:628 length:615 start_codon:yes stop_codon:yes gene_type:complete
MNQKQRIHRNFIIGRLQGWQDPNDIKDAVKLIRWNLMNEIARYSSMSDNYYITKIAEEWLKYLEQFENFKRKDGKLLRSSKSQKLQFTYEHVIPCCTVADLLIEALGPYLFKGYEVDRKVFEDIVDPILEKADSVVIITKGSKHAIQPCGQLVNSEDELLCNAGLNSSMPDGWSFKDDDIWERYRVAGLEIPTMKQEMYGSFSR